MVLQQEGGPGMVRNSARHGPQQEGGDFAGAHKHTAPKDWSAQGRQGHGLLPHPRTNQLLHLSSCHALMDGPMPPLARAPCTTPCSCRCTFSGQRHPRTPCGAGAVRNTIQGHLEKIQSKRTLRKSAHGLLLFVWHPLLAQQ